MVAKPGHITHGDPYYMRALAMMWKKEYWTICKYMEAQTDIEIYKGTEKKKKKENHVCYVLAFEELPSKWSDINYAHLKAFVLHDPYGW